MPSMVFTVIKIPTIQDIFRKCKDGSYTKEALLYQDILRYSLGELNTTEKSSYQFKVWELAEWLITHNLEMAADYKNPSASHMTKTNKIQARIGRVKRHINILLYLGLIGDVGQSKETKGQELITVYSYTEFGLLIALLIMAFTSENEKREKAIRCIYKIFADNFRDNPSSFDQFCLSLIYKLHKNNLFESYVKTLIETFSTKIPITNVDVFFNNSIVIELNEEDSKKFMKLRREALDELNPDIKRYFMHKQKLEIERKMFGVSTNLKGFEKMVFELRNDYENIAAEGFCQRCQLYIPVKLSLLGYLDQTYLVDKITAICPACKVQNSMLIPSFNV
jgi:hypothetical protein